MSHQIRNVEDADLRLNATTRIWKFATAMLALCIPLMGLAAARSGGLIAIFALIPLAVIGAAAFATAAVWKGGVPEQLSSTPPTDLKQLEERLANLEIINRYENALQAEKDVNSRLRAGQLPEVADAEPEPCKLAML
ncbi:MAG TPA: hypothetical protein VM821_02715 [Abditibacteriaceae bacterium]|jgi:hypothetical protein|nr:hypothetical protein [Abditibacteriaceae bacterium]